MNIYAKAGLILLGVNMLILVFAIFRHERRMKKLRAEEERKAAERAVNRKSLNDDLFMKLRADGAYTWRGSRVPVPKRDSRPSLFETEADVPLIYPFPSSPSDSPDPAPVGGGGTFDGGGATGDWGSTRAPSQEPLGVSVTGESSAATSDPNPSFAEDTGSSCATTIDTDSSDDVSGP